MKLIDILEKLKLRRRGWDKGDFVGPCSLFIDHYSKEMDDWEIGTDCYIIENKHGLSIDVFIDELIERAITIKGMSDSIDDKIRALKYRLQTIKEFV